MPDNPSWADIHRHRLAYPAAPIVQPVNIRHPSCPDHCSGKHGTDGVLTCPRCGGVKYRIIAHEYAWREGHYFNRVEPMNGADAYDHRSTRCCGRSLIRTAG